MSSFKLGRKGTLQVRAGGVTGGPGTWITCGSAVTVTLGLTTEAGDATARDSEGWKQEVPVHRVAEVRLDMRWRTTDPARDVLIAALKAEDAASIIGVRVLDGPDLNVNEGLEADVHVYDMSLDQPIGDVQNASVLLKPAADSGARWREPAPPSFASASWAPGGAGLAITFTGPVAIGAAALAGSAGAAAVVITDDAGDAWFVTSFDNAVIAGNTVTIPATDLSSVNGERIYVDSFNEVGSGTAWSNIANAAGEPDGTFAETTLTSVADESRALRGAAAAQDLPAKPTSFRAGFKGQTDDDSDPVTVQTGIGTLLVGAVLTETNEEHEQLLTADAAVVAEIVERVEAGISGTTGSNNIPIAASGTVASDTKAQIDAVWLQPVYGAPGANEKISIVADAFRGALYPTRPTQAVAAALNQNLTVMPS